MIAQAWSRELGLERVGREDNFFALGGHSLRAAHMTADLRRISGLEIPLRAVFQAPVLADFAEIFRACAGEASNAILRRPPGSAAPLSATQTRLWFLYNLEPDRRDYNSHASLLLSGPLDERSLALAVTSLADRNEILRSRVGGRIDAPVLLPRPSGTVGLEHAEAPDTAAALGLVVGFVNGVFDLERGPLVRALLVRVSAVEHVFALVVHHIAVDGWSMPLMWAELSAAYAAGGVSKLPEPELQYGDFAYWQREWLDGGVLEKQLTYWRDRLGGLVPAEVPADRPRSGVRSGAGGVVEFTIPENVSTRLRELAAEQGVTLFMVLLAGLYGVLARYSGSTDLAVGTPVAGRNRPELLEMIGFFVNTVVLRTDVTGDPSFTELVGRVRATAVEAYAHQDVPFERIVEELSPRRDPGRTPFFQVMFSLDENDGTGLALPGVRAEPVALPVEHAKFELSIGLASDGGRLTGSVNYATDLFTAASVGALVAEYVEVLNHAAVLPESPMSSWRKS
jgi:hypothetical protein